MASAKPLLIVLSAPSGGGKTTLCDRLLAKRKDVTRVVTCTTRAPREGEQADVHYHFLSRSDFLDRAAAGAFLEHASVYGNLYGTLRADVLSHLEQGRHVLLNIDVQGAQSVRAAAREDIQLQNRLISVFLTPPSLAQLKRRLEKRGTESAESLTTRLETATVEVAEWSKFDYLIYSSSIEEDVRRMEVVIEAELMRQARSDPPAF